MKFVEVGKVGNVGSMSLLVERWPVRHQCVRIFIGTYMYSNIKLLFLHRAMIPVHNSDSIELA